MKRKLYAALGIFAAASITTACGASFEADESTVYITKQGNVIGDRKSTRLNSSHM